MTEKLRPDEGKNSSTFWRTVDRLTITEKVAQSRYGVTRSDLLKRYEEKGDFGASELKEVLYEAIRIVGSDKEYRADYEKWKKTQPRELTQPNFEHTSFQEWRLKNNEQYRKDYENLSSETDQESQQ